MSEESKNAPKFVLFEPNYTGWLGLPHAIKDAQRLNVPLALSSIREFNQVSQFIQSNKLDVKIILLEN